MTSPPPDFKSMTLAQLRKYILTHRDDQQAWDEFTSRDRPNAIYMEDNIPLEEQKSLLGSLLRKI